MIDYVGRFAPTPTGPLHFGSLISALASFLDARAAAGRWLLRIEDLDTPRTDARHTGEILRALEQHGLLWDGPVVRQSERGRVYRDALDLLARSARLFYCTCSRRDLAGQRIYPGRCRAQRSVPRRPHAIRIQVGDERISFDDGIQGPFRQHLATDVGDFVLKRRDGIVAYQLAVVVDDALQGVTHVVRGADLLDNTPRQLFLHRSLAQPEPTFLHVPVAIDRFGKKLSKQTSAAPLDTRTASANLHAALTLLGQQPPDEALHEGAASLVEWAVTHWRTPSIPRGPVINHFVCT